MGIIPQSKSYLKSATRTCLKKTFSLFLSKSMSLHGNHSLENSHCQSNRSPTTLSVHPSVYYRRMHDIHTTLVNSNVEWEEHDLGTAVVIEITDYSAVKQIYELLYVDTA